MHTLYLLSVYLHITAAIIWIGGMFFLVLVLVPWLRQGDRAQAGRVMKEAGQRFRTIGWACFAVVLATGSFNLYVRGVRFGSFVDPVWLASPFGKAVVYKLSFFALVLLGLGVILVRGWPW